MEESVHIRHDSTVDEEGSRDRTVELQYIDAAASATSSVPDDVTDIRMCERMFERMPNVNVSNEEVGETAASTSANTERLRRERRRSIYDVLPHATFDETDDEEDWEWISRSRDELLRSLDAGVLDVNEMEMLHLWMEALETETRKAVDRQVLQECQVCLEMVRLDHRACCGLAICEDCMKKYVETKIGEAGIVRISCPNSACSRFIFYEEVRELLRSRPELRDRYDRWLVDINADPQRKTCPRCCCITEMQTGQPVDRKPAKYGVLVVCPDCQFTWCFSCQAPWHEGLTCAKNRAGDQLLKRWARQKSNSQNNAQRCPKCKIYIQRVSGCDHMTCSRCTTKFCYRCGGRRFKIKVFGYRLEDHDKKYSVIGCNDIYDDNKRLRRMFARGGIFGAKVLGGLVAMPVLCGVAGIALAAVTVAAPFYGVYRLVKRVRRPPDQLPSYNSDATWDGDFDLYMDVIPDEAPAAGLRRPLRALISQDLLSTVVEDIEIEDMEETPPPPLLPRQPIYRAAFEPRRGSAMNSPLDLRSPELDTEIKAVAAPAPPPPLPPRQSVCRGPTASVRRLPPVIQPHSPRGVITNEHDLQESVSSEEEVTRL